MAAASRTIGIIVGAFLGLAVATAETAPSQNPPTKDRPQPESDGAAGRRAAGKSKDDDKAVPRTAPRDSDAEKDKDRNQDRAKAADRDRDRDKDRNPRPDTVRDRGRISRPVPRRPEPGRVVFIGGYFYDPYYGPYPWWPTTLYPHVWPERFDGRARLRVQVTPSDTAVYVDGFYAGIADDFDGFFQSLPLLPGGHTILLYLPGHRTIRRDVYLGMAATVKLRERMEPLAPNEPSAPPTIGAALPAPPPGTYLPPRTAMQGQPLPAGTTTNVIAGFGTLSLRVQPPPARILIDGDAWDTSKPGLLDVQLPAGQHRVEIEQADGRRTSTDITVDEGRTTELNVGTSGAAR
ncbi:MAG: hypothetical protein ABL961_02820 [Vicinamibacterales bacterium]